MLQAERNGMQESLATMTEQLLAGHSADKEREAAWAKERQGFQEELDAALRARQSDERRSGHATQLEVELRQVHKRPSPRCTAPAHCQVGARCRAGRTDAAEQRRDRAQGQGGRAGGGARHRQPTAPGGRGAE